AGVGAGAVLGAGLAGGAGRAAALLPAALVSAAGRLLAAGLVAAALLLAFLVAGSPVALLAGLAGVAALVTAVGRDALELDLVGLAASLPGCGRALRARDRAGPVVASRLLGLRWGSGLGALPQGVEEPRQRRRGLTAGAGRRGARPTAGLVGAALVGSAAVPGRLGLGTWRRRRLELLARPGRRRGRRSGRRRLAARLRGAACERSAATGERTGEAEQDEAQRHGQGGQPPGRRGLGPDVPHGEPGAVDDGGPQPELVLLSAAHHVEGRLVAEAGAAADVGQRLLARSSDRQRRPGDEAGGDRQQVRGHAQAQDECEHRGDEREHGPAPQAQRQGSARRQRLVEAERVAALGASPPRRRDHDVASGTGRAVHRASRENAAITPAKSGETAKVANQGNRSLSSRATSSQAAAAMTAGTAKIGRASGREGV